MEIKAPLNIDYDNESIQEIVEKIEFDPLFKQRGLTQFLSQAFEVMVKFQYLFRSAAMQPAAAKREQQFDAVRIGGVGYLLAVEFDLVNGRINQLFVNALIDQIGQNVQYLGKG